MTHPEKAAKQSAILSQVDAEQEIQKFVKAVSSYPAHFASNPEITFAEHLLHVIDDASSPGSRMPTASGRLCACRKKALLAPGRPPRRRR